MSLILSEYIEPFSACLIKSVCKIFDVKVTNTHCCSLAKNDQYMCIDALRPRQVFQSCLGVFLSSWVEPVLNQDKVSCPWNFLFFVELSIGPVRFCPIDKGRQVHSAKMG